jgi:hypothetical protein
MNVREPIVAALEAIGEPEMIHAHEMQGGGIEIMDVDGILHDVVTEVVRLAEDVAFLHTCAGHPDAVAARMVVAPMIVLREHAL